MKKYIDFLKLILYLTCEFKKNNRVFDLSNIVAKNLFKSKLN